MVRGIQSSPRNGSNHRHANESNFGKGGLKKLMEDAESKKIQAMYFLTTFGLKGGDLQIGSRF